MTSTLGQALATHIALLMDDRVHGEPKKGARLQVLKELSDDQIKCLLYLIEDEGIDRGWGSWWRE